MGNLYLVKFGLISLVILIFGGFGSGKIVAKSSAEASEGYHGGVGGGGNSLRVKKKLSKLVKYSGGNGEEKYSASYPSNGFNYYDAYGYSGLSNNSILTGASDDGLGKTKGYNYYLVADPVYEKPAKDFYHRNSNNMVLAASNNNGNFQGPPNNDDTGPDFGEMAMASGGWGKGGGGGGWGKPMGGWGMMGGGGGWGMMGGGWGMMGGGWPMMGGGGGMMGPLSKIENLLTSALGVIALLGLLSLLQNLLMSITRMTTTTTTIRMITMQTFPTRFPGRRKRDLIDKIDEVPLIEEPFERASRISKLVLPSLNVIAHARDGKVPLDCTQREVCITNSILVKEVGWQGRSIGSVLSSAIVRFLKEKDKTGLIEKEVSLASLAGRNGKNCTATYPLCKTLRNDVTSLPLLVLPEQVEEIMKTSRIGITTPRPF